MTSGARPRKSFVAKFRAIAGERLTKLNQAMVELEREFVDGPVLVDALRELHTLKGEARMLDFAQLARVLHATEDVLHAAQQARRLEGHDSELIMRGLDVSAALLAADSGASSAAVAVGADASPDPERFIAEAQSLIAARSPAAGAPDVANGANAGAGEQQLDGGAYAITGAAARDDEGHGDRPPGAAGLHFDAAEASSARRVADRNRNRNGNGNGNGNGTGKRDGDDDPAGAVAVEGDSDGDGNGDGASTRIAVSPSRSAAAAGGADGFDDQGRAGSGGADATSARSADDAAARRAGAGAGARSTPASSKTLDSGNGDAGEEAEARVVRVPLGKVTQLTNVASGLMLRQEQQGRLGHDLQRLLRDMMDALHDAADFTEELHRSTGDRALSLAAALDGRDGVLARITALAKESLATVARGADVSFENGIQLATLREAIREMRLLSLGSLFERYPRAARDMARAIGKLVRVEVVGADVVVDQEILDELDGPLVHLLRNAIDHGLESPEARRGAGKPAEGIVRLIAQQVGARAEITVEDDGRGLDPALLRRAAVARGLLSDAEAAALSDEAALALVFRAGFSTRSETSELSGRGVGLDVVKTRVEALGGDVRIVNRPGRGAAFIVVVPVSVALMSTVIVQESEVLFALPTTAVERVVRIPRANIIDTGSGDAVEVVGQRLPFARLADVLALPRSSGAPAAEATVLCVRHGDDVVALGVHKLIGERQIVAHALDPFLASEQLVAGTAALDGGRLIEVLKVPQLFHMLAEGAARGNGSTRSAAHAAEEEEAPPRRRSVLIVDDSELTRDMMALAIGRLGFETWEAMDGQEALVQLERHGAPTVLVTDLDMPVMDGITLIERVRAQDALRHLPIIVLSTRGSDEDKRRAMDAGANHYLVKSALRDGDVARTLEAYAR